nr:WRKY53 [Persea americana]
MAEDQSSKPSSSSSSGCVCSLLALARAKAPANSSPSGSEVANSPATTLSGDSLSGSQGQFVMSHQEALAQVMAAAQMKIQAVHPASSPKLPLNSPVPAVLSEPIPQQQRLEDNLSTPEAEQHSSSDQKSLSAHFVAKTPVDCYNWRKYGEKQVKGIECSRSYYRCSHADCDVKKNVVRCYSGHVIEIMYKGRHNHDPPQKNKYTKESRVPCSELFGESESANLPGETTNRSNSPAPRREQSAALATSEQQLHYPINWDGGAGIRVEMMTYLTPLLKTTGESKVVLQTASDLGTFSDGYKWRKYGQKMVKGNPNPRSYYKCTYDECPVRRHVERASDDSKTLVITYDGKHNHEPCGSKKEDPKVPVETAGGKQNHESSASEKGDAKAHAITQEGKENHGLPASENSNVSQGTALLIAAAAAAEGQLTKSNHVKIQESTAQFPSDREDKVCEKALDLGGEKALESAQTLLSIGST